MQVHVILKCMERRDKDKAEFAIDVQPKSKLDSLTNKTIFYIHLLFSI